jgi:hypothetical protein
MSAAELALGVLLVAGALAGLFDLHFVVGKLLSSVRDSSFTSRQRNTSFKRPQAAGLGLNR